MLKPIRTVRPITAGLSMRFARKITQRAAIIGGYELSESELVFAIGAAREKDGLLSVLELLDKVLELIKRGFDRRVNAVTLRIMNNVGIMLGRGGFSREYFNTSKLFNKISSAVYGIPGELDIPKCRGEIRELLSVLRSGQTEQIKQTGQVYGGKGAGKLYKTVSERKTLTVNTLNSGLLRMTARNPELMKMLKFDKTFTELSLKNIGKVRRRTERAMAVQRFLNSLTAEQVTLLEGFVVSENLFPELREPGAEKPDLKYLLENSSEKSTALFFETLRQKIESRGTMQPEQSYFNYFNSGEEMKEFFVAARRGDIERLIKILEKDGIYAEEIKTLTEALRIYTEKTEKAENRGIENENLTEIIRDSETALEHIKQRLADESFSAERFIDSLGASGELKKIFAEYAWEHYRSDETLSRYAEYIGNTASADKLSGSGQTAFHTGSGILSAGDSAGEISKNGFAEFLINSGELNLKFAESVKNGFLSASPDVISAFAEYLVNTVREDDHGKYGEQIRLIAEKAENILYYGDPNSVEKRFSEIFSLISGTWNENASRLSGLYAEFTQSRIGAEEITALYSYLPKTNFKAVSEFFEAAAQGDEYFIGLSGSLSELGDRHDALNNIESFDIKEESAGEYNSFYDVLLDMPESTLNLLLPLAGAAGGSVSAEENMNSVKSGDTAPGGQAPAAVIAALFAEYLSDTVGGDLQDRYSGRLRALARRLGEILHGERPSIDNIDMGLSVEAADLIYNEWVCDHTRISELYRSFADSLSNRGEFPRIYSSLPRNAPAGSAGISDLLDSVTADKDGAANFFGLNSVFLTQPEKFFEQIRDLKNIVTADHDIVQYRGSDSGGDLENTAGLVFSLAGTHNGTFSGYIPDTAESGLYKGFMPGEITGILSEIKSFSGVFNGSSPAERSVYSIAQAGNKSIVTNKAFYNALTAMFDGNAPKSAANSILNGYFSENVFSSVLTPGNYFFTWEDGSVTLFNRAAASKAYLEISGFAEKHMAVSALSDRISGKFSAENQHLNYNTAAELFYTDEYFENANFGSSGGTTVNYALPAAASSGGSDEVSEKLGNIRGAIDGINTELIGIRQREEEISREFVTKSEQKIFEKELKSSIERDIYLAGKRHGIY